MLPGPAHLCVCPHCGKKRAMFSMRSGNTFGATLWSDGRRFYPRYRSISLIQKCYFCNSYSLSSEWRRCGYDKANYKGTTGTLTYEDTKDAYTLLTQSGRYDNDDVLAINLEYIRSYNDRFKRPEDSPEENIDYVLFIKATDQAIKLLGIDPDSLIIKAEIYRERKEFKSALEVLFSALNEKNSWVVEPMIYFCNQQDNKPFLLMKGGKRIDWSSKPNYESIVKSELIGKKRKIKEEALAFIGTLHNKRREKINPESDGGIYENNGMTLSKIMDSCPSHYKVSQGTEHIAEYAGYLNVNLKSISFPSSLRSIGARAFCGCENLQVFSYKALGIRTFSIGEEAFMNCKNIESFSCSFLSAVRFIGRGAFSGMDNLKEINLPEGLLEIPAFCFGYDENLTGVKIPSSVSSIGEGAFFGSGISDVQLPDSVLELGEAIFSNCKNLKLVKLPKHLKRIPKRAFSFCESISFIDIPASVKTIGVWSFEGTTSLKVVRFRGKVNIISPSIFQDSPIEFIITPWYLRSYYKKLFPNIPTKCKII